MATAASEVPVNAYEVRVWGMDVNDKPFIQPAMARYITERGALLDGVLPVKSGDTIGVQYNKQKARFRVTWVGEEKMTQPRRIGIECIDSTNIWGFAFAIPIDGGTAAKYGEKKSAIRETDVPASSCLPNRRNDSRFACRIAAQVRAEDSVTRVNAWTTDVSQSGCYLEMLTPFAKGSRVVICIEPGDSGLAAPLQLLAIVRTSHVMVGMGVEFLNPSDANRRALNLLTDQLGGNSGAASSSSIRQSQGPGAPTQNAASAATDFGVASKTEQAQRLSMDLHQLEMSLTSSDLDARLLQEFRDASNHARHVLALVQQWLDLREQKRDPFIVLPAMTAERVRAAGVMNRNLAIDLDTLEINHETLGFRELRHQMEELSERLHAVTAAT